MKRQIFTLCLMAIAAISTTAFGQTTNTGITPEVGSQHTYSVDAHDGSTYAWQVTTSANTGGTSVANTVVSNDGSTDHDIVLTWLAPDITNNQIYYLHVIETNSSCKNEKVLAIKPFNNFVLTIVNYDEANSSDFTLGDATAHKVCASDVTAISWNGTSPVTTTNATNFTYTYGQDKVFVYKVTATGITNTDWTANFTITPPTTAAIVNYQTGESLSSLSAASTTAPTTFTATTGNSFYIKITVKDGTFNEGTTVGEEGAASDRNWPVVLLNTSHDVNNNTVSSITNSTATQTISARPDTNPIKYD